MENYFAHHVFAEIQSTIDNDEEELNNQHEQEADRDFVLFEI